jgi:hypothetical protein
MTATDTLLADMARRRAELFIQGVTREHTEYNLRNQVLDGDDLTYFTRLLPQKVGSSAAAGFVERNAHGRRPIRRAFDRLVHSISSGVLQWTGDEEWSDDEKRALLPLINLKTPVVERLVAHGQAALLAWNSPEGPTLTPLLGFLFAIPSEWDATKTARLLAFEGVAMPAPDAGTLYTVFEMTEGRIRVLAGVREMTAWERGRLVADVPVNAPGLPVAHEVLFRDTNGAPLGLVEMALSDHWSHKQRLFQKNVAYYLTGLPQRVAVGIEEGTADTYDPLETIYATDPTGGITYPFPQHLDALESGEATAAMHVMEAMHAPNVTDGAGESGEARLMSLEEQVQVGTVVAERAASLLTRASELMAEFGMLPNKVEFVLKPRYSAQRAATVQNLVNLYDKGVISRYECLLRLQEAGENISQEELEAAEEEGRAQRVPPEPEPGEDADADAEDAE